MNQGKSAAFAILNYTIPDFFFKEPSENSSGGIKVTFSPNGFFDETEGTYRLALQCECIDEESNDIFIKVLIFADFKFKEINKLEEIPSFFYKNSIAIVFPYLRAFISTLTTQANIEPVILPLLNLSDLEDPLKSNTTTAEAFQKYLEDRNKNNKSN